MAKGVTNCPLVIWVAKEWYERSEILALMRRGHAIYAIQSAPFEYPPDEPDLVLHPAAGWTEDLFDYLPAALMRARARKSGKK